MAQEFTWISTLEEIRHFRIALESQRQKLVFTNGVFDLLHAGHVRYLRQARELGDALVVALNSDASTRALKGPTRPINNQEDRAEVLRALSSVSGVVLCEEPRVTKLIETIRPHIYTKGGDYTVESLNPEERDALQRVGAQIHILPLVEGHSTTGMLQKLSEEGQVAALEIPDVQKPLRIGVLGSGRGSNFEAILNAINEGRLNAEVRVVISDVADSRILKLARNSGAPALFVDPGPNPKRFPPDAQKELCDHLKRHAVEVVVLAGFMRVVRTPLLTEFRNRIVNIHPSLLPKYKGVAAWTQALEAGEMETGCTVHLVNEEIDAGQILAQETVPIHISDTPETLHARIQEKEHMLFPKVLHEWRERGLPVQ
jgi:formyltetrahydrofolate-dependent phosphoribosylglycinamide formyltransferase